jgi:broad specificity phosphatase PhoE
MTTLYLLRHGAIDQSEADCFIGQTDPPLSLEGRLQARSWRKELQNAAFTSVWSSDLKRATETAGIIFDDRVICVKSSRELREIHLGEWDGVPRGHVKNCQPDLWHTRGRDLAGFRPPGGESFRDLQERVVLQAIRIAAQTSGKVCIVTHAGVIRVLICHFLKMPLSNLFRLRLDYGSLSIVSYRPERVEMCAFNLKPSNYSPPGGEFGDQHDPAQV